MFTMHVFNQTIIELFIRLNFYFQKLQMIISVCNPRFGIKQEINTEYINHRYMRVGR